MTMGSLGSRVTALQKMAARPRLIGETSSLKANIAQARQAWGESEVSFKKT